jgi:CheY-like chemotaxis protein
MADQAVSTQSAMRTVRLLVVEDSDAYLYLVQDAFSDRERFAWQLTVARDGEQALAILFSEEEKTAPLPHIILLDWNLPKVNGYEVLRRIKQHEKLRRIPVLVFSSSEADRDIHQAYDNHANGYIVKPGSADALTAVVEAIELFWIAIAQLPKLKTHASATS